MVPDMSDNDPRIILASASPRRRELMKKIAVDCTVFPVGVDESAAADSDPARFAVKAAVLKARAAAESFPEAVVIGADTVVAVETRILGKPAGRDEAAAMLRLLSARRHRVITGLAFYRKSDDRLLADWELTYVTFRKLDDKLIAEYLDSNDYLDKAGAYAIQDVGDLFVTHVKGDRDNVVGFPVKRVRRMLRLFSMPTPVLLAEKPAFPEPGAIATHEGRRVYLPEAVAGDTVRIQITGERDGALQGELLEMVTPSPDRAEPLCPHFGSCGGCLFQDYAYPKQAGIKGAWLGSVLAKRGLEPCAAPALRAGGLAALIRPAVPSPLAYGYRNKMEFAFGRDERGVFLGQRERTGVSPYRRSVALERCPIFGGTFERLRPVILDFARREGLNAHDHMTGSGDLRHVLIREGKNTGEVMVILVAAHELGPALETLAGAIRSAVPGLASFYEVVNKRPADVIDFQKTRLVDGRAFIEERLGGLTFRIRPSTFFQTNSLAVEALYGRIRDRIAGEGGARVLGLYCGAGVLETFVAGAAASVTGIDVVAENIGAAFENASLNGIVNTSFIAGRVEDVTAGLEGSFDLAVVDPPRVGLSPKAIQHVLGLGAPSLVYVSCNPESLGRDLKQLVAAGYLITSINPFDFFPHTTHLETLVFLER